MVGIRTERIDLRCDQELKLWLVEYAEVRGKSVACVIVEALERLKREEDNERAASHKPEL